LGAAISIALVSFSAQAEQCNPITSLPINITEPGKYCLQSDLSFTHNNIDAITISSSDVTIDLNNWTLSGPYHGSQKGDFYTGAIRSDTSGENYTIQNGVISGFRSGISFYGGHRGIHVENITFKDTMSRAFGSEYASHITIVNNRVHINQTLYSSGGDTSVFKVFRGEGITIKNNNVNVTSGGNDRYVRGVETLQSSAYIIKDNSFTLFA